MKRNPSLAALKPSYLFQEIKQKVKAFKENHPKMSLINLSVGDTSIPLPFNVSSAMEKKAAALKDEKTYSGYGDEQGLQELREKISSVFYLGKISPDEIFISDGAKCDLGRLQIVFGANRKVAMQDPAYPVYHDTSLAMASEVILLPMLPENNFFPDLSKAKNAEILFFCSPHNPTGKVFSKEELETLVTFAKEHKILIVFDVAYNLYLDKGIRSIYDIPGAETVAIEVGSFSKLVGFSGVRLGWSVVPKQLKYQDGSPVWNDWKRVIATFFNGASNVAQVGGLEALSEIGLKGIYERIAYYKENAAILRQAFHKMDVFGGEAAPFLWVRFKNGDTSWDLFDHFLEKYGLITAPGIGFGPAGTGFLRFSTFGKRSDVIEASQRLEKS